MDLPTKNNSQSYPVFQQSKKYVPFMRNKIKALQLNLDVRNYREMT